MFVMRTRVQGFGRLGTWGLLAATMMICSCAFEPDDGGLPPLSTYELTTTTVVPVPPAASVPPVTEPEPAEPGDDRLDCAAPGFEVVAIDWSHPDRASSLDVPPGPGTVFRENRIRIRITNNSRHKILTSGAWLDMGYRRHDGTVRRSSELGLKPAFSFDSVPRQPATRERAETVRGHDSIEFSEHIGVVYLTDGTPPWVDSYTLRWAFENPDLENACRAQNEHDAQPTPP
ncbi:hypothetical protein [Nocardia aurea]|uniref:DUF4352 domain-containing protein n=1 Tax=Nocardia aurea TaxID=2144174 RepID=A0ABV3G1M1_9NOCA